MGKKIEKSNTDNPRIREYMNTVVSPGELAMLGDILDLLGYWNLVDRGQGCC